MSSRWKAIAGPSRLYRVTYTPAVASFADWQWQRGEGRWDDVRISLARETVRTLLAGVAEERAREALAELLRARAGGEECYRVLYSAASAEGAFIETLQGFRRSTTAVSRGVLEEIRTVVQDASDITREEPPRTGVVPASHLAKLHVGELAIEGRPFTDVTAAQSVQFVRDRLLAEARRSGFRDVSVGAILSERREFTQLVAKLVYDDEERFAGLYHGSSLGTPHENWAVFDSPDADRAGARAQVTTIASSPVDLRNPDLQRALEVLDLEIAGVPEELRAELERLRDRGREPDVQIEEDLER